MLLNTRPLAPLNGASSHFLYLWHDVNTPSYRHHISPWSLPAILHGGKLLPELAENPIGSYRASWMGKDHWLFTRQKRASWGSLDPLIPMGIFQFFPSSCVDTFRAQTWLFQEQVRGLFQMAVDMKMGEQPIINYSPLFVFFDMPNKSWM